MTQGQSNAATLIKRCKSDPALAARFNAAGMAGFSALAKKVGLPCNLQDVQQAIAQQSGECVNLAECRPAFSMMTCG